MFDSGPCDCGQYEHSGDWRVKSWVQYPLGAIANYKLYKREELSCKIECISVKRERERDLRKVLRSDGFKHSRKITIITRGTWRPRSCSHQNLVPGSVLKHSTPQ